MMSPASLKPRTIFPLPQDSVYILELSLLGHCNSIPAFLSFRLHPAVNEACLALCGLQPGIEMAFSFRKILPSSHCLAGCASHLIITHQWCGDGDTSSHLWPHRSLGCHEMASPGPPHPRCSQDPQQGSGCTSLTLPQ